MNRNFETPRLDSVNEPEDILNFTVDDLKQFSDASRAGLEALLGGPH